MDEHHRRRSGLREVLDLRRLEGVREIASADPALFSEVISLFVHDSSERVRILSVAVDKQDHRGIERALLSLKGGSATVGAQRLATCCAEYIVRMRSKELTPSESAAMVVRLREELKVAHSALAQLTKN